MVVFGVEPIAADRIAHLAGNVVVGAVDLAPLHVARGGVGQEAFDREEVRRPRAVDDQFRAVTDAVVVHHDGLRLALRDVTVEPLAVVAWQQVRNVEPPLGDRAVGVHQLGDLRPLEIQVRLRDIGGALVGRGRIFAERQRGHVGRDGAEAIVVIPRTVIETRFHAAALAGFDERAHDIGLVARGADVVVVVLRRPQAVTGHVLGGEHGVLHARVARDRDPLVDVEFVRCVGGRGIASARELRADVRAHAEVDEHPETHRLPVLECRDVQTLLAGARVEVGGGGAHRHAWVAGGDRRGRGGALGGQRGAGGEVGGGADGGALEKAAAGE